MNWMATHYDASQEKRGTRQALERDYWRLIKASAGGEDVKVEYANDLSTADYISGFPIRRPVRIHVMVGDRISSCIPSLIFCPDLSSPQSDPKLGVLPEFGSEDYYRMCGWNLNNVSLWPGSAIRHLSHPIDGINKPWLYLGMLFSSFCWHREDIYLASINYLHIGAAKQWCVVIDKCVVITK